MNLLNDETIDRLITAHRAAPVAIHLKETLLPVEGRGGVFFPPTYAGGDYNIDTLSDGTRVVTVDSVGAQANRMEPLFLEEGLRELVPQVRINFTRGKGDDATEEHFSLLKAGHRLGDAVVRSTELAAEAHQAFRALQRQGDAMPIAKLAPTSLVFGAWDSRDTQAKVPRILQSVIRAWDVSRLTRSAQYNPALDYAELEVFSEKEKEKAEGNAKFPLAQRGFVHVPATDAHGGVQAQGPIRRDLSINLVALRHLNAKDPAQTLALRRYVLALALIAAVEPQDPFLRQGCLLVPDTDAPAEWSLVERSGARESLALEPQACLSWAKAQAAAFGVGPDRTVGFDAKLAKADLKSK